MVAKIHLGNSLYGALVYNGEKINKENGRVLATNKIYNDGSGTMDINRIFEDFKLWMPSSTRTEKPMAHISLNPHPEDRLSEDEYTQLAHEYMEKMGFGDMPYVIVKHEDINRHHIHIVALRVRPDGTCVSDKNNFYRSKEITRELEKKYGLHTAERQRITPDMPIEKIRADGDIKRQVANTVKMVGMRYKFQTLGEFNAILSLYNVKAETADGRINGREYHGLIYFALDDDGNKLAAPFKASRLGKFASRTAIEARFERAAQRIDVRPTKRMVSEAMAEATSKDEFIAKLKEQKIDLVLRCNDDGRLYGATYIDHNTQTVLNGSRLGKEFSANSLAAWFADPAQKPVIQPMSQPTPQPQPQQRQQSQQTSQPQPAAPAIPQQNQSNGHDSDFDMLDLGGLFHTGPGFDAQEEAFYREMQRRKKKKRRGPHL